MRILSEVCKISGFFKSFPTVPNKSPHPQYLGLDPPPKMTQLSSCPSQVPKSLTKTCILYSSEIQMTVDRTWREFVCGWPKDRLRGDTGNPLICDGMQYGVTSHSYQIMHPNEKITDEVRFLMIKNYKWWITSVITKTSNQLAGIGIKSHKCGLITVIVTLLLPVVFRLYILL